MLLAGCGGAGSLKASTAASQVTASPAGVAGASPASHASPSWRPASPTSSAPKPAGPVALPVGPPGDGARPQTQALPKTDNAAFGNLVTDVWLSVSTGNAGFSQPAFFPEAAYKQVKAIADPQYDWRDRLWYDYTLDVAAAHRLVGGGAQFVTVVVPRQDAIWVPPGACYNAIGYWHVPGARVEYRKGGQLRSFGIASMISWRGTWYVIHLGALVRQAAAGLVDDPEDGPGVPGPPGGC